MMTDRNQQINEQFLCLLFHSSRALLSKSDLFMIHRDQKRTTAVRGHGHSDGQARDKELKLFDRSEGNKDWSCGRFLDPMKQHW